MDKIVNLHGAGGHAKVVFDILRANGINVSEIADDNGSVESFMNHEVKRSLSGNLPVIITIGNAKSRKRIVESNEYKYISAVHPSAVISPMSTVEEGTVIMPLVCVNACSHIGKHCILNTMCSVGHDCEIESFVHVAPHAVLCGNVSVGEGSWIGANATVIQGVKIGKWVTVGAGAVIIENIPDCAVVVGNPGRIIKYNEKNN